MPPRIPRACRKRGCAKTTTDRSGYCEEHRNTGWENHQQGKSRHERGYISVWTKISENEWDFLLGYLQGLNSATISGIRYTFIAAAGFRVLQLIFQKDYDLYNFVGDITMDVAKLGGASFAAWGAGSLVLTAFAGVSVGLIAVGVFVLGFGVAYLLNRFDEHFHLSEKMIAKMRDVKNTPEAEKYWKGNR